MYKQHLLFSMNRELDLLQRLGQLTQEKDLEFRPHAPVQAQAEVQPAKIRSTHELMQYLSYISSYMLRYYIKNDITPEIRTQTREHAATLTLSNFVQRLEEEKQKVRELLEEISEEELLHKEVEMPWKEKLPLGSAIINGPVKWLSAYRMQLFVHLKLNGRAELGTKEAWVP